MNIIQQNHNLKISRHIGYRAPRTGITNDGAGLIVAFVGAMLIFITGIYCTAAVLLDQTEKLL